MHTFSFTTLEMLKTCLHITHPKEKDATMSRCLHRKEVQRTTQNLQQIVYIGQIEQKPE